MNALAPVTPMLARLIPRLSSPFDGERLATLAAIERALKAKGLDFHDLAAAIDRPAPSAEASRFYSRHPDPSGLQRDRARVQWLLLAPETLRANETDFLRSIRGRLAGGRPLTFRQNQWLTAIYASAGREYAR